MILLSPPTEAHSDTDKDITTISKAIGFIQAGPSGNVDMAILYDAEDKMSQAHADEILKLTQNSAGSAVVKLKGEKVSLNKKVDISKYQVAFVTKNVLRRNLQFLKNINSEGIITVSTDEECLNGEGCLLFVKTKPDVEIYMNTKVADAAKIKFSSAFSMMIIKR